MNNSKIALLIIYNHRFDRNIPVLNKIYEGRFSHIFHVVPFYDGNEENVIPVYESSYQFSGYISQAYTHLKGKGFTHYFIVADDMIINPGIDEHNFWGRTGISPDSCYISSLISFQTRMVNWERTTEALAYNIYGKGAEISNIIPNTKEAVERFKFHNLPTGNVPFKSVYRNIKQNKRLNIYEKLQLLKRKGRLTYPLVGGYSDIFLITADVMDKFVLYCGAFAATGLFVEIAIPTAMVLACKKIQFDKDIKLKQKALWSANDYKILEKYNFSLTALNLDYPEETLFIHPIKLSKWK